LGHRVAELESRIAESEKELEVARIRIKQLEAPTHGASTDTVSDSSSGHAVS